MSIKQENISPIPQLKSKVDLTIFPNFSLPRYTDSWSDCRKVASEMYSNYSVPDDMYFNPDVIIDDYAKVPNNIIQPDKIDTIDELYEVFNSKKDAYITFNSNETITEQFQINDGQTITLDLNNSTITGEGNIGSNGRLFQVNNGKLIINNGKIISPIESYGAFRIESNGELELNNTTIENSKGWGLNIKVLGGIATLNNITVNSTTGGGIEVTEADLGTHSKAGYAVINNCNFNQKSYQDHCSTCLSVSGGSTLIVNGGSYISENWALYIFSSGGFITVNNGTFIGNRNGECLRAEIDTNTYKDYNGGFKINNGNFTGNAYIKSPAYLNINKGKFTFDPTNYTTKSVVYNDKTKIYLVS